MSEISVRLGISEEDLSELRCKLRKAMLYAASRVTLKTHKNEDDYFVAFMGKLGIIRFGNGYYLDFQDSKTDAYKAESIYGCDFGLRVEFYKDDKLDFQKAIIGQAKNNVRVVVEKDLTERKRLAEQCIKMSRVTEHYVVTFRPNNPQAVPVIHLGDQASSSYFNQAYDFDNYLINKVLPCFHGEKDKTIIEYMVSATHEGWSEYRRIFCYNIKTNLPAPEPELTYDPDGNPVPSPPSPEEDLSKKRGPGKKRRM